MLEGGDRELESMTADPLQRSSPAAIDDDIEYRGVGGETEKHVMALVEELHLENEAASIVPTVEKFLATPHLRLADPKCHHEYERAQHTIRTWAEMAASDSNHEVRLGMLRQVLPK